MINYYLLIKPGIILGNLITFAAGFLLASRGVMHYSLFFFTLLGLALIIASACVFNNYIDREIDKKMQRTKKRALAVGAISVRSALFFALVMGLGGTLLLGMYANLLSMWTALLGFFIYVFPYSFLKSRTVFATAIGSVSGAIPPVVGYLAVSNRLDLGAFLLFTMLVLWQMPHFFAIAIYRLEDYRAAAIPVLPLKKGLLRTKIHMMLYVGGFMISAALLTYFHYVGYVYLGAVFLLGLWWLIISLQGFKSPDNTLWGRQMFRHSLILITTLCLIIPFDTV